MSQNNLSEVEKLKGVIKLGCMNRIRSEKQLKDQIKKLENENKELKTMSKKTIEMLEAELATRDQSISYLVNELRNTKNKLEAVREYAKELDLKDDENDKYSCNVNYITESPVFNKNHMEVLFELFENLIVEDNDMQDGTVKFVIDGDLINGLWLDYSYVQEIKKILKVD